MVRNQLERLRRDMRQLENFEHRMKARGRTDVLKTIQERKRLLQEDIDSLQIAA